MEPEGLLPHSQMHATCPCPEPDWSRPCPHRTSWSSILILSSHPRLGLPIGFFPSVFPTKTLYMGCPESFLTFKIACHCVDLAGRGKCYYLVMRLTNCVAKTALPYLAYSLCCASLCDHMFGASGDSLETRKWVFITSNEFVWNSVWKLENLLWDIWNVENSIRGRSHVQDSNVRVVETFQKGPNFGW